MFANISFIYIKMLFTNVFKFFSNVFTLMVFKCMDNSYYYCYCWY